MDDPGDLDNPQNMFVKAKEILEDLELKDYTIDSLNKALRKWVREGKVKVRKKVMFNFYSLNHVKEQLVLTQTTQLKKWYNSANSQYLAFKMWIPSKTAS